MRAATGPAVPRAAETAIGIGMGMAAIGIGSGATAMVTAFPTGIFRRRGPVGCGCRIELRDNSRRQRAAGAPIISLSYMAGGGCTEAGIKPGKMRSRATVT